ncbi:MAG: carboxypeptidase M32 [Pirellulales bacterium]
MNSRADVERVFQHMRETAMLEATQALLEWDERTGLPEEAGAYRAEQVTQLSGMIHERKIDHEYSQRLTSLFEKLDTLGLSFAESSSVRLLYRDYQRNKRLPTSLVQAIAKACVLGQQSWEKARQADDWKTFKPNLEEIIKLKREEAQLLADGDNLYDALLDQYEMGTRSEAASATSTDSANGGAPKGVATKAGAGQGTDSNMTDVFAKLRDGLRELIQKLGDSKNPPTGTCWQNPVEVERQRTINRWAAESIGYSFQRGRLDETSHPFCTTLGPNDCRILTRYDRKYFPTAFYGTLHEAGHGMYEQGLPTDWYGLPAGRYAGLGVHESQSRLWENMVGRSEAFWTWAAPKIADQAGGSWADLKPRELYRDANLVSPSLIRVEADEATYNLHILIRFELEQRLIKQELTVADAPDAWNERYKHYLGITPPSHRDGILQDVHWSAGLVGYFPTYTLGNLYAAQLMQAAKRDLGDLNVMFSKGDFKPLLAWLRHQVHSHGACHKPSELIRNACGRPLDHQPLLDYLRAKLFDVYEL